jgi:hypothetical protein
MNYVNTHTPFKLALILAFLFFINACNHKSSNKKDSLQKTDSGWVSLFNGKNLDGWNVIGSGRSDFYVKNGVIIGKAQKGGETWLATKNHYANFILTLDFKISPLLNSGVEFRGNRYQKDTTSSYLPGNLERNAYLSGQRKGAKQKHFKKGKIYGPQIEIDPSKRAWTGGLFDEGARGWLQPLVKNKKAREAFKQNKWNSMKIIAKGNHIKSYVNGVQATDYTSMGNLSKDGFIALQIDGVSEKKQIGKKVKFKNIRIKKFK